MIPFVFAGNLIFPSSIMFPARFHLLYLKPIKAATFGTPAAPEAEEEAEAIISAAKPP